MTAPSYLRVEKKQWLQMNVQEGLLDVKVGRYRRVADSEGQKQS